MSTLPNFDTLITLAKSNPDALESLRQTQIEQSIKNAPEQYRQRLRGVMFLVDTHRQLHSYLPMGSCMKVSPIMHASFVELRGCLNPICGFDDLFRGLAKIDTSTKNKMADVLACPSR
jgi:hypothetical protein